MALTAQSILAQMTVHHASVRGRVTDPTGAVVAGARVAARQTETNAMVTTTTDAEGRFRFPYLNVGPWEIKALHPGFAEAIRALTLTVGAAFELPIALVVGATETRISVSGDATVIEEARSQIAGTVLRTEVTSLPLNGRNFLDLALLVPGVSPTNTASTQLFPETSAVAGQGISVSSQRNFSNNFIVDGLSANDDAAGLTGTLFGLDVVHEFQVVTSGGQSELGRTLGGYMNIVTRSGTNSLHGALYGFLRHRRLNAANALSGIKLPLTQAQYGATIGGPAIRDRTFYFSNFERRTLNQSGLTTISVANANTINAHLAAVGYRGPQVTTGLYPNPVHNTNFLAKLDHRFSAKDQFSLRYNVYDVHARNSRGAGGLIAPTASTGLDNADHTFAAGNVWTLSPRTVVETRGQFTHSHLRAPPSDPVGPAVSIAGVASFGTSSGSPTGRLTRMGDNNGCRPNPGYANNSRYSSLADSNYNAFHVTFVQRPLRWGSVRGSYTYSKALNNVGEFFFSSPINPFNIWQDYGRSGDDQRHRLVINGTLQSPAGPAHSGWQRLTHGFQLSGILQYYSALPFNITSGVTTIQGTAGRPIVNGAFISRNAGTGFSFASAGARLSRGFDLERLRLEAIAEAFNAFNRTNGVARNTTFGGGTFPTNPLPAFGQVTAVGDPRTFQLALRLTF